MEYSISDLVLATAGREKNGLFYVVGTEDGYVLLADGRTRMLEHPKRKKIIHVRRVSRGGTNVAGKLARGEKVLNSELRRDLAVYRRDHSQNQGG